jgi:hypothetical protein
MIIKKSFYLGFLPRVPHPHSSIQKTKNTVKIYKPNPENVFHAIYANQNRRPTMSLPNTHCLYETPIFL